MLSTSPSCDDVGLALEPLGAALRRLRVRAGVEQVVPADHLAADEAARDVGVDRAARLERGLAVAQRPGARLLLAGGEERDQPERVLEPPHDLVERRRAVAELGRLLVGELGELRLELAVDARRAVDDRDQRLRRQRIELGRELARPVGERVPGLEVREDSRSISASLRTAASPDFATFSPARGASRRGRCRRRAARASASRGRLRVAAGREAVGDREERVDLAEPAEQRRARAGHVATRIAAGVTFFAPTSSASRSRRSSAIVAMPTFGLSVWDAYAVISAPAFVSALNSVVLPAFGSPTMPTSSATAAKGTRQPRQAQPIAHARRARRPGCDRRAAGPLNRL